MWFLGLYCCRSVYFQGRYDSEGLVFLRKVSPRYSLNTYLLILIIGESVRTKNKPSSLPILSRINAETQGYKPPFGPSCSTILSLELVHPEGDRSHPLPGSWTRVLDGELIQRQWEKQQQPWVSTIEARMELGILLTSWSVREWVPVISGCSGDRLPSQDSKCGQLLE
jgi:hypothetical protein